MKTGVDVVVAGFEDEDEVAERRARLLERVVGPDDDDEGAAEEASARFRLRVSIQEPQPPQFDYSARHRAAITPCPIRLPSASAYHTQSKILKIPENEKKEIQA